MANLNITEFGEQGRDANNNLTDFAKLPPLATQNAAIGGASVQSAAFSKRTGFIRLRTDLACAVVVAANPTALITSLQMSANTAEYFAVPMGADYKIAVIAI